MPSLPAVRPPVGDFIAPELHMTPLRVAILGGGIIANVHRRTAQLAGGQVAAGMIPNPQSSALAADRWGVPNA